MPETALKMLNITKNFPGVTALKNVNFSAEYGEVLALIGENGAGKSTLMKVLNGVFPHSEYDGDIFIDGQPVKFKNPKEAEKNGVAIIYQERTLIQELSVAENIFLDRQQTTNMFRINWNHVYSETQKILDSMNITNISPMDKIKNLSPAKQQMIEIAKALSVNSKIIVFDEPTSALNEQETEMLFQTIRSLKKKNTCIIYISHKMNELVTIADRIQILRDGEIIGTPMKTDSVTIEEIIKKMIGKPISDLYPKEFFPLGKKILEVKNLKVRHPFNRERNVVNDVTFCAYEGEILGITGLSGSGRSQLASAVFGANSLMTDGSIFIERVKASVNTPADAIAAGIALLTEDRKLYGLIPDQGIPGNMTLSSLNSISNNAGILNKNKEKNIAIDYMNRLNIKPPDVNAHIDTLSGGNQQKVILGKWFNTNPKILILDEPTKGVDVSAKTEIYKIMNSLVSKGVVIILISSDLSEITGMSDRVLVMADGIITGTFSREEFSHEKIIEYCNLVSSSDDQGKEKK